MKRMVFVIVVLFAFGCTPNSQVALIDLTKAVQIHPSRPETCVVNKEWLNLQYDHKIDYINNIPTDFFLLVYSNSPTFCDFLKREGRLNDAPFQCKSPNKFGWVIHGLWGESLTAYLNNDNKKHPRFCKGDLDPLSIELMLPYLCMSPGTKLLQGEWEKHGACDFDNATIYFEKTLALFNLFKLPPPDYDVKNAVEWMKNNNQSLGNMRFHVTETEFGICFSKDFEVISCPVKN